MMTQLGKKEE